MPDVSEYFNRSFTPKSERQNIRQARNVIVRPLSKYLYATQVLLIANGTRKLWIKQTNHHQQKTAHSLMVVTYRIRMLSLVFFEDIIQIECLGARTLLPCRLFIAYLTRVSYA